MKKKTCFLIVLRYGLILPQKKGASKTAVLQKPSVFGDDSDDEVGCHHSLHAIQVFAPLWKVDRFL